MCSTLRPPLRVSLVNEKYCCPAKKSTKNRSALWRSCHSSGVTWCKNCICRIGTSITCLPSFVYGYLLCMIAQCCDFQMICFDLWSLSALQKGQSSFSNRAFHHSAFRRSSGVQNCILWEHYFVKLLPSSLSINSIPSIWSTSCCTTRADNPTRSSIYFFQNISINCTLIWS